MLAGGFQESQLFDLDDEYPSDWSASAEAYDYEDDSDFEDEETPVGILGQPEEGSDTPAEGPSPVRMHRLYRLLPLRTVISVR